jgi:hypothetical protein
MNWFTLFLNRLGWLVKKVGIMLIILLALVVLYYRIFAPAITDGWTFKPILQSLVHLAVFLGITATYLFFFYITTWIFTGRTRDFGGKCPLTRWYIIFAIYSVFYVIALGKYFANGP